MKFTPFESIGLLGNDHFGMLEKNSDAIAKYIAKWIHKRSMSCCCRTKCFAYNIKSGNLVCSQVNEACLVVIKRGKHQTHRLSHLRPTPCKLPCSLPCRLHGLFFLLITSGLGSLVPFPLGLKYPFAYRRVPIELCSKLYLTFLSLESTCASWSSRVIRCRPKHPRTAWTWPKWPCMARPVWQPGLRNYLIRHGTECRCDAVVCYFD